MSRLTDGIWTESSLAINEAPEEQRHTTPKHGIRLVILESPYAGDVQQNIEYARRCLADCLRRGEAPFASHLLYTQPGVLDDAVPAERRLGIEAGLAWGDRAHVTVCYIDRGITPGMQQGIDRALDSGRPVEFRTIVREQ